MASSPALLSALSFSLINKCLRTNCKLDVDSTLCFLTTVHSLLVVTATSMPALSWLKNTGIRVEKAKGEGQRIFSSSFLFVACHSLRLFTVAKVICHQVNRWQSWDYLAFKNHSATQIWLCVQKHRALLYQSDVLTAAMWGEAHLWFCFSRIVLLWRKSSGFTSYFYNCLLFLLL